MQSHINSLPGSRGVLAEKATERIKRRGRIGVQQGIAQPRLADFANGQVLSLVAGITETHFPVPRLKVIAEFSHLTTQTDVEELVPVSELLTPWTRVVGATKPNTSSHRHWYSVNNQSRVANCEGIKRIRDWHADAGGTE